MQFFCIYIREAHPEDGWQLPINTEDEVVFHQPQTDSERAEVAQSCVLRLSFAMPMLIDGVDDRVDIAYSALPDRLFLIDAEGRLAWRSEMGPWGFDVDSWESAIQEILIPA